MSNEYNDRRKRPLAELRRRRQLDKGVEEKDDVGRQLKESPVAQAGKALVKKAKSFRPKFMR